MKKKAIFGTHTRKAQPRLRMIANGSSVVNSVRSQSAGNLYYQDQENRPLSPSGAQEVFEKKNSRKHRRGRMKVPVKDIEAGVFVHFTNAASEEQQKESICNNASKGKPDQTRDRVTTARIPLNEIKALVSDHCIAYVEQGEPLKAATSIELGKTKAPLVGDLVR